MLRQASVFLCLNRGDHSALSEIMVGDPRTNTIEPEYGCHVRVAVSPLQTLDLITVVATALQAFLEPIRSRTTGTGGVQCVTFSFC